MTTTVDNHLGQTLENAELDARLDEHAKEILADKTILAEIIQRLIPEFRDMPTEDIIPYISSEPYVDTIRVHPGETNRSFEEAARSLGQENKIPNEGLATFDVLIRLRLPGTVGDYVEVYVDLEAQNGEDLPYLLEARVVYYLARLLSSQYHREFHHSEYQNLRKVYSIWIVMEGKAGSENTISSISYQQKAVVGVPEDNGAYDLSEGFIVRLPKEDNENDDRLIRVMNALFAKNTEPAEKKKSLTELGIPVSEELERRVNEMCNYSHGVREDGRKAGFDEGRVASYFDLVKTGYSKEDAKKLFHVTDDMIRNYQSGGQARVAQ